MIDTELLNHQEKWETANIPYDQIADHGFLGLFRAYCDENAPYLCKPAVIAGSLVCAAFLAGRKYVFQGTHPNIYSAGLSSTGTGKDFPKRLCSDIVFEAAPELRGAIATSIGSGQGMEEVLIHNNGSLLILLDECAATFKVNERDTIRADIQDRLLEYYSSNKVYRRLKADRYHPARNNCDLPDSVMPSVCFMGTSVPERTGEILSQATLSKGLINRVLFFAEPLSIRQANAAQIHTLPDDLIGAAKQIYNPQKYLGATSIEIEATDEADEMLMADRAEFDELYNKDTQEHSRSVLCRCFEQEKKLALIFAVSRDSDYVEKCDVERAERLTEYAAATTLQFINKYMFADAWAEQECKTRNAIAKGCQKNKGVIDYSTALRNSNQPAHIFQAMAKSLVDKDEISIFIPAKDGVPEMEIFSIQRGCMIRQKCPNNATNTRKIKERKKPWELENS